MKRIQLWMSAAIRIFCGILLLTACSSDDDPIGGGQTTEPVAQQAEDVRKSLIGLQVDLSDIMLGGDDIILWKFMDDGTCEMMNMSMVNDLESDEDAFASDIFEGTWEAFANVDNPLDESTEKQNGFRAKLTLAEEDRENGESEQTYYVETVTDGNGQPMLLMLSDVAIAYQLMTNHEGGEQGANLTKGFVNDIFEKKEKKETVVKVASQVKKKFGTTFPTISGSNRFSDYTGFGDDELKAFYKDANKALSTMLADFKVSKTDYAEWMSEIYTKKGKNPRICDMSIPGTHDTYTYYLIEHALIKDRWATTQVKPISGQWEAGARVFDFRLRYKEADGDYPEHMQLYHTLNLYIDFEKALQEIVDQLEKHPGETAIASIAFDDTKTDNHLRVTNATLKKFVDKGKIVVNPAPDVKLSDCAGKIIVMYSYEFDDDKKDLHTVRKDLYGPILHVRYGNQYSKSRLSFYKDGKKEDVTITYQNLYEESGFAGSEANTKFWKRKTEYFETCFWEYHKYQRRETTVWSWNQLNAYIGNFVTMSYSEHAEAMHPWAVNFVLQNKNQSQGIVTMDFIGSNDKWYRFYPNCEALPKIIVESNRYQSYDN